MPDTCSAVSFRFCVQVTLQALTGNSVEYMQVYRDASERVAREVHAGVSYGRALLESSQQIDKDMQRVGALSEQVRAISRALTRLEAIL